MVQFDKYDDSNIFARIIRGEIPCKKVYEDDKVLSFYDINPKGAVHILVIPKREYMRFQDFCVLSTSQDVAHFFKILNQIALDVSKKYSGYKITINNDTGGGQEVPHFHAHIICQ